MQRCPDGSDTNVNGQDFQIFVATPGSANVCKEPIKITTEGFTFTPDELSINVGDVVEFVPGANHNVLEVSQLGYDKNDASKAVPGGFFVDFKEIKQVTFNKPGVHYYVCVPHAGGGMKGKITVK